MTTYDSSQENEVRGSSRESVINKIITNKVQFKTLFLDLFHPSSLSIILLGTFLNKSFGETFLVRINVSHIYQTNPEKVLLSR